ncbi:MAG: carboxypeptidase-like regulatory domain-containing protein, partial [Ferruginibacter sp.]
MRKLTGFLVMFLMLIGFSFSAIAQSIAIKGNVKNASTQENSSAVSVTIKGGTEGTYTDDKGDFVLTAKSLPVTLVFSSIGYETIEKTVSSASPEISVMLQPKSTLGQEV